MDEKKLTYEEVIETLERCLGRDFDESPNWCASKECKLYHESGCTKVLSKNTLDLIHRLQEERACFANKVSLYQKLLDEEFEPLKETIKKQKAEIERLTSLYDGKTGFMTSSIGDLPLTVEGLRKAIDEVSRLFLVQGELQELNAKYYNEAKDLRREKAELQKQVGELTDNLIEKQNALWDLQDDFDNLLTESKEQAVKDTAKEILQAVDNESNGQTLSVTNILRKRYGVEVE